MASNQENIESIFGNGKNQYPLFYLGDDERHYLYFQKTERVNDQIFLIYGDEYLMCDIRDQDMKLNMDVNIKGYI